MAYRARALGRCDDFSGWDFLLRLHGIPLYRQALESRLLHCPDRNMTCLNKIIAGLNLWHGGRNVRQRTKRNKNILMRSAGAIGLSSVTSHGEEQDADVGSDMRDDRCFKAHFPVQPTGDEGEGGIPRHDPGNHAGR